MERESFLKRFANFFKNSFKNIREFLIEHMPRRKEKIHRIDAYVDTPPKRQEQVWDRHSETMERIQPERDNSQYEQPKEVHEYDIEFNEKEFREKLKMELEKIFTSEDLAPQVDGGIKAEIDALYQNCLKSGDQTIDFVNGYSIYFKQVLSDLVDNPVMCDIFLLNENKEVESTLYTESNIHDRNELTAVYAIYEKMKDFLSKEAEHNEYEDVKLPEGPENMCAKDLFEYCKECALVDDLYRIDLSDDKMLLFERYDIEVESGIIDTNVKATVFDKDGNEEKVLYNPIDGIDNEQVVYDALEQRYFKQNELTDKSEVIESDAFEETTDVNVTDLVSEVNDIGSDDNALTEASEASHIQPDSSWEAKDYYDLARRSAIDHPDGKSYLELPAGNKLMFEKYETCDDIECAVYLVNKDGDISDTIYSPKDGLIDKDAVFSLINGESPKDSELEVPTEEEYKAHVAEVLADKSNSFKLMLDDGRAILIEKETVVKQNYFLLDETGKLERPLFIPEENIGSQDEVMKCLHIELNGDVSKAEALYNLHRLNVIQAEGNSHIDLPNGKTLAFTAIGVDNKEQMMFDCNVRLIDENGFIEKRLYQPLEKIGNKEAVVKFIEESFGFDKQVEPQPTGREDLETPREKAIADVIKNEIQPPQNEMIEDLINKAIETQEDQIINLPGGKVMKFEPETLYAADGELQTAAIYLMSKRGEYEKQLFQQKLTGSRMLNDLVTTGGLDVARQCYIEHSHGENSLDETIDEKRQQILEERTTQAHVGPKEKTNHHKDEELSA